jgi:hypothetical protein
LSSETVTCERRVDALVDIDVEFDFMNAGPIGSREAADWPNRVDAL